MKPLFTVHAGELLVGCYIERNFPDTNVWLPAKDTGIDLLVSDKSNKKTVSLQVKFSRDYIVSTKDAAIPGIRASGWWTLTRSQMDNSPAEYWVFVLARFANRSTDVISSSDFIIIEPKDLLERLSRIHGKTAKKFQSYLRVEGNRCYEARGDVNIETVARDFSMYLNVWTPITKALNG